MDKLLLCNTLNLPFTKQKTNNLFLVFKNLICYLFKRGFHFLFLFFRKFEFFLKLPEQPSSSNRVKMFISDGEVDSCTHVHKLILSLCLEVFKEGKGAI